MKNLTINSFEDDVENQIDRLNLAVHQLMAGIEISAKTPRNPSQLSFVHPDWIDEDDEEMIPESFEQRFEEVLVQLDRLQMQVEDFWSEQVRKDDSLSFINEEYVEKLERENKELRLKLSQNSASVNRDSFSLSLKKNPGLETEKKNFEEKLAQLDKLNDLYHQKQVQILKVQESLRVKEKWIEHKEHELRVQRQNFEKTKVEWERDRTETVKEVKHVKLAQSYDKGTIEACYKPEAPPPTVNKRQESLSSLQFELTDMQKKMNVCENKEESQKLVMKIDSIKNKIAAARGQKALLDSNKSSRLISNMMKTMEKEVNYEENKRKLQLEKAAGKKGIRNNTGFSKFTEKSDLSSEKTDLNVEGQCGSHGIPVKAQGNKLLDEARIVEFRKGVLDKREKELNNRESVLQETWMKTPGSKELIQVVNLALEKLTEQKNELDLEREEFEKEKIEMFRIRDKLKDQLEKIGYSARD